MVRKYKTKLGEAAEKYVDLISTGYLLAIDPSSGSQGSLPGYAIFRGGRLEDMGVIELPRGTRAVANRLHLLAETLREAFEKPDVLAVELISPVMPVGQGRFVQAKNSGQLMKSVGVIMSVWDAPVLEPAPVTWHTMTPPGYKKTDASDAYMIGYACLATAARLKGLEDPVHQLPSEYILGA